MNQHQQPALLQGTFEDQSGAMVQGCDTEALYGNELCSCKLQISFFKK